MRRLAKLFDFENRFEIVMKIEPPSRSYGNHE